MFEKRVLLSNNMQKSLGRPHLTDTSGKNNGILEQLNGDLKRLRDEKEAAITKRKAMDQELRVLNDKIGKMVCHFINICMQKKNIA